MAGKEEISKELSPFILDCHKEGVKVSAAKWHLELFSFVLAYLQFYVSDNISSGSRAHVEHSRPHGYSGRGGCKDNTRLVSMPLSSRA